MTARKWLLVLLAFALVPARPVPSGEPPEATADRSLDATAPTIAVGDVHGDYRSFAHLLESLGLVDEDGRWTGGRRHLVQTGDLVDRGPESRRVIELLMRLEREASADGGRVTVLLGNHEAMNLTGDLYYVSPGEYAAFARDEDPEFRRERERKILSLLNADQPLLKSGYYAELGRLITARTIGKIYPPGYFAQRRAFSRRGKIGRWLASRDVVHVEKGILFVHGGLSPRFAAMPPAEVNRRLRASLDDYFKAVEKLEEQGVYDADLGSTELQFLIRSEREAGGPHPDLEEALQQLEEVFRGPLFAEDGPLWYRGLAENDEKLFRPTLREILNLQRVERIVVGHTVHPSLSIKGRFGNRVIMIDTGMNQKAYGGRPSALVIHSSNRVSIFATPLERAAGR